MTSEALALKGAKLMRLMMFTVMLSSMSVMMFNVVLPQISSEFQLTLAQVSWISSGYTLIYAFGTVVYGKLSDRFSIRNLLTIGLLIFAIGSFIGLLSQSFATALIARCIQSAGASAIPAIGLIIPTRYFPLEKRASAMSMTAVGVALGGVMSPVVSGLIVSFANWRWLFLPSLLLLLLLPLFRRYLDQDDQQQSAGSFDWIGALLLAFAISTLMLGVTNQLGYCFLLSVIGFIGFIIRIRRAKEPFIQPRLFSNKQYVIGVSITFLVSCIGISFYFLTPIMLSDVHQLEANWIGFMMVPAALASAILGRQGGKLADAKGSFYLYRLAVILITGCFLLLSFFLTSQLLWVALILMLGNVGQSFMQIAMSSTVSRTLNKQDMGVGMGLFSMLNFISQGIATGIYGIIVGKGITLPWNPFHIEHGAYVFASIYAVLIVLHLILFIVYRTGLKSKPAAART